MSNVPSLPHPVAHMLIADGSDDVYTSDQMREYGRACERAAYERAAQECREQAKFHAVHRDYRYDFKADGANECAAAIEALGADK